MCMFHFPQEKTGAWGIQREVSHAPCPTSILVTKRSALQHQGTLFCLCREFPAGAAAAHTSGSSLAPPGTASHQTALGTLPTCWALVFLF